MIVKILSFDPGTTVTGWACAIHNRKDESHTVVKCGEITPIKDAKKTNKDDCVKYTTQLIALDQLYANVYDLIRKYKPDVVVTEDAFFHRFVQAYASLNLCVHTISRAARAHGLTCERMAPRMVKKLATSTGEANKLDISTAIESNENITVNTKQCQKVASLSEHVNDAIAVGYAYAQQTKI